MAGKKGAAPATAAVKADPPSDHSLLRLLRSGDQDAATQLYLRYAKRLRALARAKCSPDLARRVDADDIVQSVFRSFFRRATRGCYDVPAGEELWKLLLVIALNKIRKEGAYHRAAKRDVRLVTDAGDLDRSLTRTRHDEASRILLRMVVREVLEPLRPQQRRVIELRIEGHEVAEIAAQVGSSKRTVERTLQEFRSKLRTILDKDD